MTEPLRDDPELTSEEPPRREPAFNLPRVVLGFIALCVLVHLVRVYVLDLDQDFGLVLRAAFIPIRYSGEYVIDIYALTSPVTYSLLHGGMAHLAINMVWLAAFGSPLASRIGAARFVIFWIAASVAAAGLHYVLHMAGQSPLVGASGAISGMMGAAARFGFRIDRRSGHSAFAGPILPIPLVFRSRAAVTFLAVWMIINLVTGLVGLGAGVGDSIAWEAHIGGFLVGFLGVGAFDRPDRDREPAPEQDLDGDA